MSQGRCCSWCCCCCGPQTAEALQRPRVHERPRAGTAAVLPGGLLLYRCLLTHPAVLPGVAGQAHPATQQQEVCPLVQTAAAVAAAVAEVRHRVLAPGVAVGAAAAPPLGSAGTAAAAAAGAARCRAACCSRAAAVDLPGCSCCCCPRRLWSQLLLLRRGRLRQQPRPLPVPLPQ